jgi:hypothetical protein
MNTTFWGPSGWQFLHTLTFIYPEQPSYTDKVKMQNFMKSVSYILPCKYCRISFTKYSTSLPIIEYLDNREKMIEWLYKIHNKVNKKLRSQGFCKYENPELTMIKNNYKPIIEHITNLCSKNENTNMSHTKELINYICNLGRDFLGSIIFNYQGYFSNCHSGDEKIQIVAIYHTFFNSIIPLLCSYLSKLNKDCNINVSRYENEMIHKLKTKTDNKQKINNIFKIRNILMQNEAYTKLIKWFYNCNTLCRFDDTFNSFELYMNYYSKNIVLSCNTPVDIKGEIIKSCRKTKMSSQTKHNKHTKITKKV